MKKNKVKEVFVYIIRLNDSTNFNKTEDLRFVFYYDSIGRRTKTKDFSFNILHGTFYYYYEGKSFEGIKQLFVFNKIKDSTIAGKNDFFNFQQEKYTDSSKFICTYNNKGLLSVIIDYSVVRRRTPLVIGKIETNVDYMHEIKKEPQTIFKFDYKYY